MRQIASARLAVGLIFVAGCGDKAAQVQKAPLEVVVQRAEVTDVPVMLELVGTIDGFQNAEIRARTPGYVEAIHYKEGSAVKKGDLLFTIDPILAQASVTSAVGTLEDARAALAKSNADVARLQPLAAKKAVSQQELDDALAAQQAAKARVTANEGSVQSARANLSYTKITAPIDGIAGIAKVRVGNLVGQAEPTLLTTVSTLDPVRVRFSVPEQQYLKLADRLAALQAQLSSPGVELPATLELTLADGSVYPHKGRVAVVDRQLDISTGTLAVEALFPNPNGSLRPGQFAKIRGRTSTKQGVVLVPQRAVRELQGGYQVGVVGEGGKVEIRPVVASERVGSDWVIDKGLKRGDQVIVEGLMKVRPGDVVTTKERSAVAAAGEAKPGAAGNGAAPDSGKEP